MAEKAVVERKTERKLAEMGKGSGKGSGRRWGVGEYAICLLHLAFIETMISIEAKTFRETRMAGKTISAYTDEETANRIAHLAKIEQRKPAQIASSALKFFLKLPPEAHAAIRQIEVLGSPADSEAITKEVTRALLHVQYRVAHKQVIDQMKVENLDQLESEEDILAEAVALTR